jgi:hypothetical protein
VESCIIIYGSNGHLIYIIETRGFILLILNQLRLMADARHSDLISRIITDHPRFQEFLPTLRIEHVLDLQHI